MTEVGKGSSNVTITLSKETRFSVCRTCSGSGFVETVRRMPDGHCARTCFVCESCSGFGGGEVAT